MFVAAHTPRCVAVAFSRGALIKSACQHATWLLAPCRVMAAGAAQLLSKCSKCCKCWRGWLAGRWQQMLQMLQMLTWLAGWLLAGKLLASCCQSDHTHDWVTVRVSGLASVADLPPSLSVPLHAAELPSGRLACNFFGLFSVTKVHGCCWACAVLQAWLRLMHTAASALMQLAVCCCRLCVRGLLVQPCATPRPSWMRLVHLLLGHADELHCAAIGVDQPLPWCWCLGTLVSLLLLLVALVLSHPQLACSSCPGLQAQLTRQQLRP